MSIPTCKLCKTPGVPGAAFCGACGTPYGAAPPGAAAAPAFATRGAAPDESDLDDLFSSLPSPPLGGAPAGGGAATQLFMDAVGPGEDLFGAPSPGASPQEEVAELTDLFASPGAGTGNQARVRERPPEPGLVTNILTASGPEDGGSLDDLFGDTAAMDPDALFRSTGTTGTMQKVAPRSSADDLDDLFASAEAGGPPPNPDEALDDLFSGGAASPTGAAVSQDGLADLFGAGGEAQLFQQTGGASTEDLFGNPAAGAPLSGAFAGPGAPDDDMPIFSDEAMEAADALFNDARTSPIGAVGAFGNDFSDEPDSSAPASATIDVSMETFGAPTAAPAGDLESLFGMGAASASGSRGGAPSFDATVPDLGATGEAFLGMPSDDAAAANIQELMRSQEDDSAPAVPGLESGDLIQEAHRVADGDGRGREPASHGDARGPHDDAVPPRPKDRRGGRRKAAFATLPPEPGWWGKLGALGGLLLASGFLSQALGHHPALRTLSPVVLASCLAIMAGVVYVFAYAALKIRLPVELQARCMALGGVAFVYTQVSSGELGVADPALAMLLCMAFAIGTVLESGLLFLSLRISLGIVGTYACLSLLTGVSQGLPYVELVTRRVLEAPGLAAHLAKDQLALVLQAFDPLFVAVNFFLPTVLVLGLLEALQFLWRRWWGLASTRLATCAVAGVALWLNLGLYQSLKVPSLRTLLGI